MIEGRIKVPEHLSGSSFLSSLAEPRMGRPDGGDKSAAKLRFFPPIHGNDGAYRGPVALVPDRGGQRVREPLAARLQNFALAGSHWCNAGEHFERRTRIRRKTPVGELHWQWGQIMRRVHGFVRANIPICSETISEAKKSEQAQRGCGWFARISHLSNDRFSWVPVFEQARNCLQANTTGFLEVEMPNFRRDLVFCFRHRPKNSRFAGVGQSPASAGSRCPN